MSDASNRLEEILEALRKQREKYAGLYGEEELPTPSGKDSPLKAQEGKKESPLPERGSQNSAVARPENTQEEKENQIEDKSQTQIENPFAGAKEETISFEVAKAEADHVRAEAVKEKEREKEQKAIEENPDAKVLEKDVLPPSLDKKDNTEAIEGEKPLVSDFVTITHVGLIHDIKTGEKEGKSEAPGEKDQKKDSLADEEQNGLPPEEIKKEDEKKPFVVKIHFDEDEKAKEELDAKATRNDNQQPLSRNIEETEKESPVKEKETAGLSLSDKEDPQTEEAKRTDGIGDKKDAVLKEQDRIESTAKNVSGISDSAKEPLKEQNQKAPFVVKIDYEKAFLADEQEQEKPEGPEDRSAQKDVKNVGETGEGSQITSEPPETKEEGKAARAGTSVAAPGSAPPQKGGEAQGKEDASLAKGQEENSVKENNLTDSLRLEPLHQEENGQPLEPPADEENAEQTKIYIRPFAKKSFEVRIPELEEDSGVSEGDFSAHQAEGKGAAAVIDGQPEEKIENQAQEPRDGLTDPSGAASPLQESPAEKSEDKERKEKQALLDPNHQTPPAQAEDHLKAAVSLATGSSASEAGLAGAAVSAGVKTASKGVVAPKEKTVQTKAGKKKKNDAASLKPQAPVRIEKIDKAEYVPHTDRDGTIKQEKNYFLAEESDKIIGVMVPEEEKELRSLSLSLKRKRAKLVISLFVGLLSLAGVILLFALSGTKLPGAQGSMITAGIEVGVLALNAALNWKLFYDALTHIFQKGKFSAHVPALLSVIGALVHDVLLLTSRDQLFGSAWVYTPIALLCIVTSLVCEIADDSGKIACLEFLSKTNTGSSMGVVLNSDLAKEITQRAFGDDVQAAVPIRRSKVTGVTGDTSHKAYSVFQKAIPALAVLSSIIVFAIKMGQGVGVFAALATFGSVLCICSPAIFPLCTSFGTYKAIKSLTKSGCALAGYDAAVSFTDLDALVVDQSDLFEDDEVQIQGIKTFGENRIDEAILLCASVLANTGGPLYKNFLKMIDGNTSILLSLKNLTYEEGMGYAAWFEGGRRVLIGNAALMESHDILLPVEDYEAKLGKAGKKVMYIADRGRLIAFFVAEYKVKPEYRRYAKLLDKYAVTLLIKGYDPNIDAAMIERMFKAPEKQVRLVSRAGSDYFEDHVIPPDTIATGAYVTRGVKGSVSLVLMCEKLKSTVFAAHFFAIASCLFGAFLSVMANASGKFYEMSTWQALVYQIIWLLPAVSFFFMKKR